MADRSGPPDAERERRWETLRTLDEITSGPLIVLSLVWLALLVAELTVGLARPLDLAVYIIWALFVADFIVELVIAPDRGAYLRSNWLMAIALVVPVARVLRLARVVRLARAGRVARSLNLVRVVTSINRGIAALGRTLARRGAGYVGAITVVVVLGGSAGMWAFENPSALVEAGFPGAVDPLNGLDTYGSALWWTLMILVTMGTDYWPVTTEGRILTFLLALYGFAVFGYITATIASHFVGRDRELERGAERPSVGTDELAAEVRALRAELAEARGGTTGRAEA